MVDIKKDDLPVIYKQDIMDEKGKLNTCGALLVIGTMIAACNMAFDFLSKIIVDKDDVC